MKHAFVLMAASVGILAACTSIDEIDFNDKIIPDEEGLVERVVFEAPVIQALGDDDETRASLSQDGDDPIRFGWEATDFVGIYPDQGGQVYFSMSDGVGSNVASFDGGGWALRKGYTYSCYYPLVSDMFLDRNAIPVSFANQVQTGVSSYDGVRFFLASEGTSSSAGTLHFTFQMLNTVIRIKAIGLPAGTYTKLTITAEDPLFVQEGTYGLNDLSITGETYSNELELSLEDYVLTEASTEENPVFLYLTSAPVDLSGKTVVVSIYSEDGDIYQCEKTLKNTCVAGSWVGWKCVMESSSTVYTKVSSITVGGTYLIVDAAEERLFKGATDGSYLSISPKNDVIIDVDDSFARYEFTVERTGNDFFLKFNDGRYLVCNYTGNSSAGLAYVNSQADVLYPYALTTGVDGAFFFSTTQVNSVADTNQVLYFKTDSGANIFKIGGSGRDKGVRLFMKNGKLDRGLGFEPNNVTCFLGETPEKPILSGVFATATYSSSDESIARVDADGNVTPVATGTVTISATVEEDDQYNAGSAFYTLKIRKVKTTDQYVRVTSADQINVDGEYVLVYDDGSIQKVFKPILNANKNAFQTSSNAIDVVIDEDEIEASDVDDYRIMLANQEGATKKFSLLVPEADGTMDYYLVVYKSPSVFTASTTETGYRVTFSLSPEGVLTLTGSNSYKFQYSSSGSFTADTGASANLYLFVRTGGPVKQRQTLSFTEETVSWALGDDYEIGRSYDYPQQVSGAQTPVTYSAEPESVTKIEGGKITIMGYGAAVITATAAKSDKYFAATAHYTLRILKTAPTDWVDMGSFNLENQALYEYLNDANAAYTDTNENSVTVMDIYSGSAYSSIDRKDCPAPVTIEWTNAASTSTLITIYEDQDLTRKVWAQNATEMATSTEVYNLIPGSKYYYTVSEDSVLWEKGYFNTTGRRRMIKVSDVEKKGHANNCRDLGGLAVTDKGESKTIKYGYLFRGSNMDKTTITEKSIIADFLNVGMDVDLRSGKSNSPGQTDDGNSNCYQPFQSTNDVIYDVNYINPGFNSFSDLTTDGKVKSVLMAIFETAFRGKATYFHCYVGADRTGYIAMLIEGLLGVSEKDCSIDYELTSFSDAVGQRFRTGKNDFYFGQGLSFLRNQEGDTFQDKIENYLVNTVRISQADIDEFKRIVLE